MKILIFIMACLFLLGCTTISDIAQGLEEKTVNRSIGVFGGQIEAFNPSNGSWMPTGKFGTILNSHQTVPTLRGQGIVVTNTDYFWFTWLPAHTRTTFVMPASEKLLDMWKENPEMFKTLKQNVIISEDGKVRLKYPKDEKDAD